MNFRKLCKAVRVLVLGSVAAACTLMSASALESGTTTASQLNIRTEPFGPVITMVPEGTTVAILAQENGWAQVSADGVVGYASMEYITVAEQETTQAITMGGGTITADDVNFRAEASTSSSVLGRFQSGTDVNIVGVSNGWFEVEYNGQTGFVYPDYIVMSAQAIPMSDLPSISNLASISFDNSSISPIRQAVLEFAAQFLGTPYKYGGASPDGFDCSGFTYYVYKNVVKEIPRTASDQRSASKQLSVDELLPGDLVFFRQNGQGGVGHAGIYVGDGQFIHSPTTGDYVSYDTLSSGSYKDTFVCGGRFID